MGIYQNNRTNLDAALEAALRRRMESVKAEQARIKDVGDAINTATMQIARGYVAKKDKDELKDMLAKLKAEKAEAEEQNIADVIESPYNDLITSKVPESMDAKRQEYSGPSLSEIYSAAMSGYQPRRMYNADWYRDSVLGHDAGYTHPYDYAEPANLYTRTILKRGLY